MKKRIIIAAAITACLALCAAMWPLWNSKQKPKRHFRQRKKRLRFHSRNRPRRPSRNRSQHLRKHPQSSPHRSQNLSRKCLMVSPRSKLQNRT